MKKIILLGGTLASGGAEHQSVILMDLLVERGYDVTFVSFVDVKDHYHISPKIHRVHIAKGKPNWWKLIALQLYILTINADVLIAFSQRMSVLSLFMLLFRPKVKVISGERNFTVSSPDKFEHILCKTRIYNRSNYIVPNNYSQGRYLAEKLPSLRSRIRVIINYTDVNKFISSPVPNNKVVQIGIFCRFERQKNFHRFLDALHLLNQSGDYKYHIDWYGNQTFDTKNQKDYLQEGIKKIEMYGLSNFITLHGPSKEVNKLIPSYDLMCLPSLHEGFSNSISEYICCGRPVICSDVSDNSMMVHDGYNGFLFNPLDVNDIANAFVRYFNTSSEERTLMGESSRKIALALFNKNKFIDSYISLIEE